MNATGLQASAVICEFNPFHNGHAHLLSEMRRLAEGDVTICIMSGRWVQRGSAAVLDPYQRAKTAILAGADLVIELPFPWSASSAESFGAAGVSTASRIGAKKLFFGSEKNDPTLISDAARASLDPRFADVYATHCTRGSGSASAYIGALKEIMGIHDDLSLSSNDLLAVSYVRAIMAQGVDITPVSVKRLGSGYNDEMLSEEEYPSATALRRLIGEAWYDEVALRAILDGTMPNEALDILTKATRDGFCPADSTKLMNYFHATCRMTPHDAFENIAEMSGGLSERICRTAHESATAEEFFNSIRNKHHTDARLRRALLFASVGVTSDDVRSAPSYTTLLAANRRGCEYLGQIRKSAGIKIVTKPADTPDCRQRELALRADSLYTLCLPTPRPSEFFLSATPYIEN